MCDNGQAWAEIPEKLTDDLGLALIVLGRLADVVMTLAQEADRPDLSNQLADMLDMLGEIWDE